MEPYANLKISGPKDGELTLTAEIPNDTIQHYRKGVLDELRKDFEAPGFRKGKVPEEIFVKQINEYAVLEDAAHEALQQAYIRILKDKDLKTLGSPEITITKLAPGNAVEFSARVGVVPEFSLPNYKKIARETENGPLVEVADADVENVISELKKMQVVSSPNKDESTPELTDEFVKKLGTFQDVAGFKNKIKENLKQEKEFALKKKNREAIVAAIVAHTKITIPKLLIDQEIADFKDRILKDLKDNDKTLSEYLASIKKTEEEFMNEERNYIEQQIKTKFVLEHIAAEEKIVIGESEIAEEMRVLAERRPDIRSENARYYAEAMLKTEKVLELLENRG